MSLYIAMLALSLSKVLPGELRTNLYIEIFKGIALYFKLNFTVLRLQTK